MIKITCICCIVMDVHLFLLALSLTNIRSPFGEMENRKATTSDVSYIIARESGRGPEDRASDLISMKGCESPWKKIKGISR